MILNAASRQFVLNEALEHAFGKRKIALGVEYDRIAKAIYDAIYPRAVQTHIYALPRTWYKVGHAARLNVAGERRDWQFNGDGKHGGPVTNTLRLPSDTWGEIGTLTRDKHAALIDRISDYDAARKAFREEHSKAESTLTALLKGVRTVEQLKEVWPEGHKFYKGVKAAVPTPPGLPAIAMADLNKMLGLAA